MMKRAFVALAVATFVSCEKRASTPPNRVELRRLTGDMLELIPYAHQLPYCLVFTVSQSLVVRQLTMNRDNRSVRCDPGKPIRGVSFRIPVEEGKVKIFVFLSDRRLDAGSIGQQVYGFAAKADLNLLDLRLPGQVFSQIFEFTPEPPEATAVGEIIHPSDGGVLASPDAGP